MNIRTYGVSATLNFIRSNLVLHSLFLFLYTIFIVIAIVFCFYYYEFTLNCNCCVYFDYCCRSPLLPLRKNEGNKRIDRKQGDEMLLMFLKSGCSIREKKNTTTIESLFVQRRRGSICLVFNIFNVYIWMMFE